jgi:hypothetical protein
MTLGAPACTGFREGSDHFGSYVRSIFLTFLQRGYFQDLNQ